MRNYGKPGRDKTSGHILGSSVTFGNTNIPRSEFNNNYVPPFSFSEKTKLGATMASQEVPTTGNTPASTPAMGAISRRTATTTPKKKKTKIVTKNVTEEEETVNISTKTSEGALEQNR